MPCGWTVQPDFSVCPAAKAKGAFAGFGRDAAPPRATISGKSAVRLSIPGFHALRVDGAARISPFVRPQKPGVLLPASDGMLLHPGLPFGVCGFWFQADFSLNGDQKQKAA
jgi:hypothetical protein